MYNIIFLTILERELAHEPERNVIPIALHNNVGTKRTPVRFNSPILKVYTTALITGLPDYTGPLDMESCLPEGYGFKTQ